MDSSELSAGKREAGSSPEQGVPWATHRGIAFSLGQHKQRRHYIVGSRIKRRDNNFFGHEFGAHAPFDLKISGNEV